MTNAYQIDVRWNLEQEWNCTSMLYTGFLDDEETF